MPRIALRTRLKQRRDCAFQTLDGETVVLLPRERTVHALNEVGSFLWGKLAKPTSASRLVRQVCEEFEVEERTAREDVLSFLRTMVERELVRVDSSGPRRTAR